MISITLSRSDWKLLCWQLRQPADVAQFPRLKAVIEGVESQVRAACGERDVTGTCIQAGQLDLEEYLDRSCDE